MSRTTSTMAEVAVVAVTEETSLSPSLNQDAMWKMNLRSSETMESGPYIKRPKKPNCFYYIRTRTCKFGAACRFHPPRDKAGIVGRVFLNILGYPLRPNETQCAYYLRIGQCTMLDLGIIGDDKEELKRVGVFFFR